MTAGALTHDEWPLISGSPPIRITDVWTPAGTHAARLEHYVDTDPDIATALPLWQTRMRLLDADLAHYQTIVIDSFSFLQDLAVTWHRLNDPPTYQGHADPRKWYANAKDDIQRELMGRLAWIDTKNLVVLAHASEKMSEFGDDTVRSLDAIGKLAHRLGTAFGEVYHTRVVNNLDERGRPDGTTTYSLQTQTDGQWGAMSLIDAPNGCPQHYDALWQDGAVVKPLHCLAYGNFGTGKSTFASTWPQPMLVMAADPFAKLIHYERLAQGEGATHQRAAPAPPPTGPPPPR